jgi:hypothetical protein
MIIHCLLDFNIQYTIPDELVWSLHIRSNQEPGRLLFIPYAARQAQSELSSFLEQAQINQCPTEQFSAILYTKKQRP